MVKGKQQCELSYLIKIYIACLTVLAVQRRFQHEDEAKGEKRVKKATRCSGNI